MIQRPVQIRLHGVPCTLHFFVVFFLEKENILLKELIDQWQKTSKGKAVIYQNEPKNCLQNCSTEEMRVMHLTWRNVCYTSLLLLCIFSKL